MPCVGYAGPQAESFPLRPRVCAQMVGIHRNIGYPVIDVQRAVVVTGHQPQAPDFSHWRIAPKEEPAYLSVQPAGIAVALRTPPGPEPLAPYRGARRHGQ